MADRKSRVGIEWYVVNRAGQDLKMLERDLGGVKKQLDSFSGIAGTLGLEGKLAGLSKWMGKAGAGAAIAAPVVAFEETIRRGLVAYADQEKAERALAKSLAITNDARSGEVYSLKQQAEAMAAVTTYSDEQILREMAIAHNMGLTTDQIATGTKAAIGLAAAYDKDLSQAMRVVAMASQGETRGLKEMGILIDQNTSAKARYDAVLAKGHAGYQIAIDEASTLAGGTAQLRNAWKDLKQEVGEPFADVAVKGINAMTEAVRASQPYVNGYFKLWKEGAAMIVSPPPTTRFDKMYTDLWPSKQQAFREQFQAETGEEFKLWGQARGIREFGYTNISTPERRSVAQRLFSELQAQQQAQAEMDMAPPATAGAAPGGGLSQLTPEQERAVEQVDKLNAALNEQVKAAWLVGQGHEHAAEQLRFEAQVRQAYSGDLETQNRLIEEYKKNLGSLEIVEKRTAEAVAKKRAETGVSRALSDIERQRKAMAMENAGVYRAEDRLTFAELPKAAFGEGSREYEDAIRRYGEALDGIQYEGKAQEARKAKDEIAQLDRQLEVEMQIIGRVGQSHEHAADMIRYEQLVRSGYSEDLAKQTVLIENHAKTLEKLAVAEKVNKSFQDLSATLADIAMDFKNAEQYATQFGQAMLRQALQEQFYSMLSPIKAGVINWLNGSSSPGPYVDPATGINTVTGEIQHDGGRVGVDRGLVRQLPAAAWSTAPRYHEGVAALGLRTNERRAVLEVGETVVPADRDKAARFIARQPRSLIEAWLADRDDFAPRYHEGGRIGDVLPAMAEQAPIAASVAPTLNARFEFKNETGVPIAARQDGGMQFDGRQYVQSIILEAEQYGGEVRDSIQRMARS